MALTHTLPLSRSGETLSGTFLLLFYIASSLLPSFAESSHPSFLSMVMGGGVGCGVGLCHVERVSIRGGHSGTGAGGCGDEGVISSLGDR